MEEGGSDEGELLCLRLHLERMGMYKMKRGVGYRSIGVSILRFS